MDVVTSLSDTVRSSMVTDVAIGVGRLSRAPSARSDALPHVEFWSSISKVLHSPVKATKIRVPGFTVHDSAPVGSGASGATTLRPRSQHANFWPPVPKEFLSLGVWSTVVHSAAR